MRNIYSIRDFAFAKISEILYKPFLNKMGKNVRIINPLRINGFKNISIDDNVIIQFHTWLAAVPIIDNAKCILKIGKGTAIGNLNHIYATREVIIGENVLTADKVYISDNLHGYENINLPIIKQKVKQINSVYVGDGTWIGENVAIIGVKIGKNCVIGANAVVTKDVPDYSIVVGIPAKIIKRYDIKSNKWRKTNEIGEFI